MIYEVEGEVTAIFGCCNPLGYAAVWWFRQRHQSGLKTGGPKSSTDRGM